ncbi:STAS domain-containing protein [Spirillospora sp. CA-294931]|uniref:STAS domain-containing protein n=1 Tax=Spirillospora sp. CA-294931 TaxID=3240042 RepID=UPI003D91B0E0
MPTETSSARIDRTGSAAVLHFPAEVDIANEDEIQARSLRLLEEGVDDLVIDLMSCRFCGSSGVNIILRTHLRARELGTSLSLRLPATGLVRRVCSIAGVTRVVPVIDQDAHPDH